MLSIFANAEEVEPVGVIVECYIDMRTLCFLSSVLLLAGSCEAQVTLATSQYDNARTGANLSETLLNTRNVNVKQFGKLFTLPVDGDVYAQPLYVAGLEIPGKGVHNVLFVATEHDSVYAFDAANHPNIPLWTRRLADETKRVVPVPVEALGCPFISPEIGITATPVIDSKTRTIYVLARTREGEPGKAQFWQRLHALDLTTGREKPGSPVVIKATIESKSGSFLGWGRSTVEFLALHENPRAALLLSQGKVYLTWASSCDEQPYHGWVMAYDAHTLQQLAVLNTSPETMESGIWQSDTGPAADEDGNVYLATGNGVFDAAAGGRDYGDSLLRLRIDATGLHVHDYFTPFDQAQLSRTDADLGSGGPMLIPPEAAEGAMLAVVGGKGGVIYLLNRDNMGKFDERTTEKRFRKSTWESPLNRRPLTGTGAFIMRRATML